MSSRFVTGGTLNPDDTSSPSKPPETSAPASTSLLKTNSTSAGTISPSLAHTNDDEVNQVDDEWARAQKDVQELRARREADAEEAERSRWGYKDENAGKSLYEVLQENKAAKQAAFEESIRLKNQFRTLDSDEVEFLEEIRERERDKEEMLKRETMHELEAFRKRQSSEATLETEAVETLEGQTLWGTKRKRKDHDLKGPKGIKLKKKEGHHDEEDRGPAKRPENKPPSQSEVKTPILAKTIIPPSNPSKPPGMGLVGYGSSDDED